MKKVHGHSFFLVLGLCIMAFVIAVYVYMDHEIGVAISRAADARSELNSASVTREKEQSFMNLYQSTASKWQTLPQYFVPSNDVVSFIKSIESLSKESGADVAISSIGADNLDGAAPGTQGAVRMHVSASGSWGNVMRALSLAEALPYKVTINNVNLSAGGAAAAAASSGGSAGAAVKPASAPTWSLTFDLSSVMLVPAATSTTP